MEHALHGGKAARRVHRRRDVAPGGTDVEYPRGAKSGADRRVFLLPERKEVWAIRLGRQGGADEAQRDREARERERDEEGGDDRCPLEVRLLR